MIAQEVLTYEGLHKKAHLLDQLIQGLQKSGILKIIRTFPEAFIPMFVYEKVYAKDVLEAIYVPKELESDDDASLLRRFLRQFINESNETGEQNKSCVSKWPALKGCLTYIILLLRTGCLVFFSKGLARKCKQVHQSYSGTFKMYHKRF